MLYFNITTKTTALKDCYILYELLEDSSFQYYAKYPDSQEAKVWTQWLEAHPEQKECAERAKQMVIGLQFRQASLSSEAIEDAWLNVDQRIRKHTYNSGSAYTNLYYSVAASVSLLILAIAAWWIFSASYQMDIQTAYGETKFLTLPDGSEVTLNANSRLRYDVRTLAGAERTVKLGGEAFFHIVQRKDQISRHSFSVITPEGGTVEVLGTAFNVQSRRNITQVVLQSGKVQFKTEKEATTLEPGEMVEYSSATKRVHKKNVQAEIYSAWKDKKLYFDETPLTSLAVTLEDTYGLKTIFKDEMLKEEKISGAITATNLNTLLQAVERLLSISISRQQDTLYFESHTP
ncbi:FecR family protein [Catalinimonas niigatensis]|uniref:FecR family protein n=1 Tax=Catalinimonas niigatensis TaxID=1397264 RepID=UPI002666DAEE|nr:FecR domain-containing protein [Catalinimonas niigatensis]WPP50504.1 FecR domain-containing protein [Catalinimonas niigatensis]